MIEGTSQSTSKCCSKVDVDLRANDDWGATVNLGTIHKQMLIEGTCQSTSKCWSKVDVELRAYDDQGAVCRFRSSVDLTTIGSSWSNESM